jgi:hypothetical protein
VHGLLVADEPGEGVLEPRGADQRVLAPGVGERDLDGAEGLPVGAVDQRALMGAEGADAVAGAEEGEVVGDDLVQHTGDLRLGAQLRLGLVLHGVRDGEGAAAQDDAGELVHRDLREGIAVQARPEQVLLPQAGEVEHGGALGEGDVVLRTGGDLHERFHPRIVSTAEGAAGPAAALPRRGRGTAGERERSGS